MGVMWWCLLALLGLGTVCIGPVVVDAAQQLNEGTTSCGSGSATLVLDRNGKRRSVLMVARATNTDAVCVGATSGMTCPSSSTPILPGQNFSDDVPWTGQWYCRAAAGTQSLDWKELTR